VETTKKRRKYSNQFKVDGVKLVTEQVYKVSGAAGVFILIQIYVKWRFNKLRTAETERKIFRSFNSLKLV